MMIKWYEQILRIIIFIFSPIISIFMGFIIMLVIMYNLQCICFNDKEYLHWRNKDDDDES